ncbi:MAG: DUF559 domain-containing protein [Longimicrobiales bacterium]
MAGPRAEVITAVLTCGPYAVGSHLTAGHVHDLLANAATRTAVSVWRGRPDPREGVELHRVRLSPDERTVYDGVPVTSVARTVLDLAAVLRDRGLEQALARALRFTSVTNDELLGLVDRYPRRTGAPRLRALLTGSDRPAMTRSEAEERFLALVREADLPRPQANTRVHGFEADFFWRTHGVVVEIDGLTFHTTRSAQQRDRRRDSTLGAAGIRVLRFTWQDVTTRSAATLAKVALALGRSAL